MLRITETLENNRTIRLRLDGTITPQSFEDVDQACARHREVDQSTIILDLAGVSFMHAESAQKLAELRGKSLRIINCSPFIAALLDTATKVD
jgi:anti-anti-sigma regulatory factor